MYTTVPQSVKSTDVKWKIEGQTGYTQTFDCERVSCPNLCIAQESVVHIRYMPAAYKKHPENPMNMAWEKCSKVAVANFMCPLDWAERCQIAGKVLFVGVSLRVFWEEISIWISRLNKDLQSPMNVGITYSNEKQNRTEWHGKGECAHYLSWTSTFSSPHPLTPLVFRPSDVD